METKNSLRCDAKNLSKHMCTLQSQGLKDCFKLLSEKSLVECRKCGVKANSAKNICAANALPMTLDIDDLVRSRDA